MARTYTKNASNFTVYTTVNLICGRLVGARQSSAFAWVKAASYGSVTGNNCIMNAWLGSSTNNAILMDVDNTGAAPTLRCGVRGSSADAKLSVNSVSPISLGRWYSVGFIADYAAGTIRCYVNGRFEAAASGTLTTPFASTANIAGTCDGIGTATSGTGTQGTGFQWDGQIESPCLYRCNIGDAGMRRLHEGETPKTVYPASCIWWPYCGPEAGSKLIDKSHYAVALPITGSVPVATGHNGARLPKRAQQKRSRTRNMTPSASISDTVVFADSNTRTVSWGRSINDTSAFSDAATKVVYWNRTITDTFGTADSSPESEVDVRIVLDSFATVHTGYAVVPNATNAIIFVDGATGTRAVAVTANDSILLDDSSSGYTGTSNIFNLTVLDGILFADRVNRILLLSITDSFTVDNLPGRIFTAAVTDSCAFTHDGERGSDREVSMNLAFNEVLTEQKISRPIDNDAVAFTDRTSWSVVHHSFLTDHVAFNDYSFESTGGGFAIVNGQIIPSCDIYPTALGIHTVFHMQYPVVSPTNTLDLRVPQFGDERHYTISTKIKRTLDGFPRIVRPGTWPKIEKFNYTFMYLTATQREAFIAFFDLTGGQLIKVVDQDNIAWQGVILEPKISTEQVGPGCQFKLEFSFRGTKL